MLIQITVGCFLGGEKDLDRSQLSLARIYVIHGLIRDRVHTFTTDCS